MQGKLQQSYSHYFDFDFEFDFSNKILNKINSDKLFFNND
jgi:hypothetical protein